MDALNIHSAGYCVAYLQAGPHYFVKEIYGNGQRALATCTKGASAYFTFTLIVYTTKYGHWLGTFCVWDLLLLDFSRDTPNVSGKTTTIFFWFEIVIARKFRLHLGNPKILNTAWSKFTVLTQTCTHKNRFRDMIICLQNSVIFYCCGWHFLLYMPSNLTEREWCHT